MAEKLVKQTSPRTPLQDGEGLSAADGITRSRDNEIPARKSGGITKAQIKQIHVLKTKLGWDDETYRNALRPYFVDTSKELSFSEAKMFIRELSAAVLRFQILMLATEKQRKMIIAKWYAVTRVAGVREKMAALNAFLKNRFNIKNLNCMRRDEVEKVAKALSAMREQEERQDAAAGITRSRDNEITTEECGGWNEDDDAAMESHAMD